MEDLVREPETLTAGQSSSLNNQEFCESAAAVFDESDAIQRFGMFASLRSALAGINVELGCLSSQLGLASIAPENISATDYAALLNYLRVHHSDLFDYYIAAHIDLADALAGPRQISEIAMTWPSAAPMRRQPAIPPIADF